MDTKTINFRYRYLFVGLFIILTSCYEECSDNIFRQHSDAELEYFYYQPDDTLFFVDTTRSTEHYLTCTYRNIYTDSTWWDSERCLEGGYFSIKPFLTFRFKSNFPFYDQNQVHLTMEVVPINDSLSWIQIDFKDSLGEIYWNYYFEFNNQNQLLTHHYTHKPVDFMGNELIQGKEYQNIYRLVYLANPNGVEFFYDTLYYNQDGFLKFISTDYGYVLERLP